VRVVSGAAELHLLHRLKRRARGACTSADIKNEKARKVPGSSTTLIFPQVHFASFAI
jgi:hypothetical protein